MKDIKPPAYDAKTLRFYNEEAISYAKAGGVSRGLVSFIKQVGAGSNVLELGCGAGHNAEALISAGMRLTAIDASPALAAIASKRIGQDVRVMRFDEINSFDGVWAMQAFCMFLRSHSVQF
ncbi:MAG: class I SAM-dependent methyltransferase [Pseudomonadota bacterium]